jgi:hypothetical protein
MSVNAAFYDDKRRSLLSHELVDMPRDSAALAAIQMGLMMKSGYTFPGRYWVVWESLDDLGVFPLDQVDSEQFEPIPEKVLDRIEHCARRISRKMN